jgi:hypothetical protein
MSLLDVIRHAKLQVINLTVPEMPMSAKYLSTID